MQTIEIKINGIPVISSEYELKQGVEAGNGFVIVEKDKAPNNSDSVTLRFNDSEKVIEISNLRIVRSTDYESNDGENLVKLKLADSRESWKKVKITGRFNVTEADCESFVSTTLNNGAEYTLKDLLEFCFEKVNDEVDLSSSTLEEIKPRNIVWDNEELSTALNDLLAIGDVNICCGTDGKLRVLPRTTTESVEYNQKIVSVETVDAQDTNLIPGKIKIVGKRTWVEKELSGSWEPVCISDGTNGKKAGEIYSLSTIALDWGLTLAEIREKCLKSGGFNDIPGNDDEIRIRSQILERCAYKWYRYTGVSGNLPWLTHRAETDSTGKPLPIKVEHTFFRLKNDGADAFGDPFENVSTPTESSYSYNVDCDRGIVKFRDIQGNLAPVTGDTHDTRLEGRVLASGAEIKANVAWELESTDDDGIFEYEKVLDEHKNNVFILKRDDFRLRQFDNGTSVVDINRTELELKASEIADEITERFNHPVIKRIKYAGCYRCDVTGSVRSVKYQASVKEGLTTTVEIFNISQFPGDVILEDKFERSVHSDSSGEERSLKKVNAYSVGPVVIKADEDVLAESMSFVKASGTPDNMQLKQLGIMRNPFFWERESEIGGWVTLSLASVIAGTQPYYSVKESDEEGIIAKGSKGIDVTNLQESSLDIEDLVIVFETHNGHKVAFPLNKTLTCDHKNKDESNDNKSTEVSDGDEDDEKVGDFDDILWIKRDQDNKDRLMLNINSKISQAFYTGDGVDDAVAVLGGKKGVLIAPNDCELHVLGKNKDNQPVIEGHITTEVNFYQDRIGDGPIDFVQAIRMMGDDPLGKYHKADMWWDYDQKKWIPWYQLLWQKIPPTYPPPTYPPPYQPVETPVSQPVDEGTVVAPNPANIDPKPVIEEIYKNFLGCDVLPWCGMVLGEYSEGEVFPGIVLRGGDGVLMFEVPQGKPASKVMFDENVEVEFKDNVKIEGSITGGDSSDSWLRLDGQNSPSANIDWGGRQIVNVCHIQQKDDCKHYFGDSNDASIAYDTSVDCLKVDGKDLCVNNKVKTQDKFCVGENEGLTGTMTIDDGSNFSILMNFNGGILTSQTIAGSTGVAGASFE